MKHPVNNRKNAVLFIVGPTAIGKSEIALRVARKLQGEIVSADSMQIYRGMDIGTGKPTRIQQREIRHHLLDFCAPSRIFSVYDFYRHAMKAIRDIGQRGRLPIVTGGSGLYIHALLQGLETRPGPDYRLRKKLETQSRHHGILTLVKRLQQVDPEAASKMDLKNERRIIRALEVHALSKKNGNFKKEPRPSISECGFIPVVIGLRRNRDELYRRIEKRIDQMFRKGWVQEAKKLSRTRIARTARQALGYRHLFHLFQSENAASSARIRILKDLVKKDTRHFAKRQMTWFRREENLMWVDWPPGRSAAELAHQICEIFSNQISPIIEQSHR